MFQDCPDVMTVEQVHAVLPLGINTIYELANTGRLKCIRVRRRILISKQALIEFVTEA